MNYSMEILYIVRIVVAVLCGYIIGFERELRLKEAGVRTHCLVACGAALMMIISKYGFFDMGETMQGVRTADPARIAAQVVSGIGFIGSGIIFVNRNSISGLTTAAGIWTTAGVGMAIGGGMYLTGIAITVFIVVVQIILHLNNPFIKIPNAMTLEISNVDRENYQKELEGALLAKGISIKKVSIKKVDKVRNYKIVIESSEKICEDELLSMIEYDSEIKTN